MKYIVTITTEDFSYEVDVKADTILEAAVKIATQLDCAAMNKIIGTRMCSIVVREINDAFKPHY